MPHQIRTSEPKQVTRMTTTPSIDHLRHFGYCLLRNIFDAHEIDVLANRLSEALKPEDVSVLQSRGKTYGSRDLMKLLPETCDLPRRPVLREFVSEVLGPHAGLVRALFFDKPPGRRWSLPWHKDRTIAVKNNSLPTSHFSKPTLKAGIPHVEAPESLLAGMLTLRVHIDAMNSENGPLSVIPGSHVGETQVASLPVELHAEIGDVLAMRPLLSHSSSLPAEGATAHRRIVHLEFAPSVDLPDEYEWNSFVAVSA